LRACVFEAFVSALSLTTRFRILVAPNSEMIACGGGFARRNGTAVCVR